MPFARIGFRWWIPVWLAAGWLLPGFQVPAGSESVRIHLSGPTRIQTETVTLGQVADIQGHPPELLQRLRDLELARAPLPGQVLRLDDAQIRMRLRQLCPDAAAVLLAGESAVEVVRASTELSGEKLADVARDCVAKWLAREGYRGRIAKIQAPGTIVVPDGRTDIRADLPDTRTLRGTIPVRLTVFVDDVSRRELTVPVKVEIETEAVLTRLPLKAGHILSESDVLVKTVDLSEIPSTALVDIHQAVGRRLRRPLGAFEILRSDLVEVPPLVRRGDVVQIVAETQTLRIRALGVVRDSEGREGERIRVVNLDSDRPVQARVVDAKTVYVDF